MSVNPITIRNLGPEDAHILEHVRPGLFENGVDLSRAWALLATRINELVVALDRGEVVGLAYGTMLLRPDQPPVFLINAILVHEDVLRQGLGRRMFRRLQELAEDRGCERLWTLSEHNNGGVADRFYEAMAGDAERSAELKEWLI